MIYMAPATFLQDRNQFAIGSQPYVYRAPTDYLEDPSNFCTGPHPSIYRTYATVPQEVNHPLLASPIFVQDPNQRFT